MSRAKLAICSSMKNENEYLLEWLCFHKVVGVEKFVVYNNEGTDDSQNTIDLFNKLFPNSVELIDWPGQPGQRRAFSDMLGNRKHVAEWVAFIDADEFLFGTQEDDLKEILATYGEFSGVGAHWLNFGSNGHIKKPPGLCIEEFTKRAHDTFPTHSHVKSILKIEEVVDLITVHLFETKKGTVNENMEVIELDTGGRTFSPTHEIIRINHYITKSEEQLQAKILRGRPRKENDPAKFRDIDQYRLSGRNSVSDKTISRFIPAVRDMIAKINSLPEHASD